MAAWMVSYSVESIKKDLSPSIDRPAWVLSSYGPAKHQSTVIAGLDVSQEELRLRAVEAIKSGAVQDYVRLGPFILVTRRSYMRSPTAEI